MCGVLRHERSTRNVVDMTPEERDALVHLRRAHDLMDREYANPLDVPAGNHTRHGTCRPRTYAQIPPPRLTARRPIRI